MIDIRDAQEENVDALADLFRDARLPLMETIAPEQVPFNHTKDWYEPWRKHFSAGPRKSRAWVAWQNETPIGFCHVGPLEPYYEPYLDKIDLTGCGELCELYLLPQAIGTGLGKRMMMYAMQSLHDLGYTRMILSADLVNERARHFYEAFGLETVRTADVSIQRSNGGFICPLRFMIGPV